MSSSSPKDNQQPGEYESELQEGGGDCFKIKGPRRIVEELQDKRESESDQMFSKRKGVRVRGKRKK